MNNNNNNEIQKRRQLNHDHKKLELRNKDGGSSYSSKSMKLVEMFCSQLTDETDETRYRQNYIKDNNQELRILKEVNDDKFLKESKSSEKEGVFDQENLQPNDNDEIYGSDINGIDAEMDSDATVDSEAEVEFEQTFFDEKNISNEWTAQLRRVLEEWPDDKNDDIDDIDDIDYNDNDCDRNINRSYNYCHRKGSKVYCNTNDSRHLIKFSRNNNFDVMTDIDKLVRNMIYNTEVNDINSGIPLYSIGSLRSPFTSGN